METGFKQMLRDRIPEYTNLALKWCKVKGKWIDYVYDNEIWFLADKEQRKYQTKAILGLVHAKHHFDFNTTIEWDDLDKEEIELWTNVKTWVEWFKENLEHLKSNINSIDKQTFMKTYMSEMDEYWQEKMYSFLRKNIS